MDRKSDEELIQDFLKDCQLRGMSRHSIQGYKSSLNLFKGFLQGENISLLDVDRHLLKKYLKKIKDDDNVSYKTMQNRFSAFISFYDYIIYEDYLEHNIIRDFRKRYLARYKDNNGEERKLISVEEMARFINMILDIRAKTLVTLFAKTGIRRRELVSLDVDDIDMENMSITLKPTNKRSNLIVYFDYETAVLLRNWLERRKHIAKKNNKALFVSYTNHDKRLNRNTVGVEFTKWATLAGLHDPKSNKLKDKFTPHNCRHWYSSHLRRGGMSREYIKELRGDEMNHDALDTYLHIDHEDLRKSYLIHIPKLGII